MESPSLARPSIPDNSISHSPNSKLYSSKIANISVDIERGLPSPGFPLSINGFYTNVNKSMPAWSESPDLSCSLFEERATRLPRNLLKRRFPKLDVKPESISPTLSLHNPLSSYGYQVGPERSSREVASIPRPREHSHLRSCDTSGVVSKGYLKPTEKHIHCQREIRKYKSSSVEPFIPVNPHRAKDHTHRKVHGFTDTPYEIKRELEFSEYMDKKMKWSGRAFRAGVANKVV